MGFFRRIFNGKRDRAPLRPLYDDAVAYARDRRWFIDGEVPDTIDGRFDMLASVMALLLIRLEKDEATTREESALLAELFIDDMEGSLRQIGIGDLMVGKHVGKMMGALGGRLTAFRPAARSGGDMAPAVRRNVFHDAPPSEAAVVFVAGRLEAFSRALEAAPTAALLAGELPQP